MEIGNEMRIENGKWGMGNGQWNERYSMKNERITAATIIKTNNKLHVAIKIGSQIKIYMCVHKDCKSKFKLYIFNWVWVFVVCNRPPPTPPIHGTSAQCNFRNRLKWNSCRVLTGVSIGLLFDSAWVGLLDWAAWVVHRPRQGFTGSEVLATLHTYVWGENS